MKIKKEILKKVLCSLVSCTSTLLSLMKLAGVEVKLSNEIPTKSQY